MIPILLTVENLQDANAQYKFNGSKNIFKLKDALAIKQALGYAIYGNSTLFQGKVELSFKHDDENFILERDFGANSAKLSTTTVTINDIEEVNNFMASIVGYNSSQWDNYVIADKEQSFDSAVKDINAFVKESFTSLGIDSDALLSARSRIEKSIEAVKAQMDLLSSMSLLSGSEVADKVVIAREEVAGIKAELARLNNFIIEGRSLLKIKDELDKVNYQLDKEKEKESDLMLIISKLKESEEMEKVIFLYEKNNEITTTNAQLSSEITLLEQEITALESSISKGEKAQAEKEKTYIYYNEKITELNNALDSAIKENAEKGDLDKSVFASAEAYYEKSKEQINILSTELKTAMERLDVVDTELATNREEFNSNRYDSQKRTDIREGALLEGLLEIKKQRLAQLKISQANVEATLLEFERQRKLNANIEANGKKEEQKVLQDGYEDFFESYNALERNKQEVYKGQIISAHTLGELKAIDHKIFDNEQARQSYLEDINALNNAKNILIQYIEKCEDKLNKQNEKLIGFMAKQEYYKEVEELEFGGECPVCKCKVLDKTDMSIDNTRTFANVKRQEEEIAKTKAILAEYVQKLEKINIRIGDLASKEKTSANYIESLKNTKETKIAVRENIYKENNVKSHEELTAKVEDAVRSILNYSNSLAKINQAAGIKNFAADSNNLLDKYIEILSNSELPAINKEIKEISQDIKNLGVSYSKISERLEKAAAEQLDEIASLEKREDTLIKNVNILLAEKETLETKIGDLNEQIRVLAERKSAVTIEGKTYDYSELCVMLTGKKYQEIIGEIRRVEAKRQESKDEFVAIKRVLADKKQELITLHNKVEQLSSLVEINNAYIADLNSNGRIDPELLKIKNISSLRKVILTDNDKQIMQSALDDHALRMGSLSYQSDALNTRIAGGKDLIENFKANCDAYRELQDLLYQKEDAADLLIKDMAVANTVYEKLNELHIIKTEKERAKQTVDSAINQTISEEFVGSINNFVRKFSQKYYIKESKGLVINYIDKKGLEKEIEKQDEETSTIVALAIIDAIGSVVARILDVTYLPRIINIKPNLFNDATKQLLLDEASKRGMLLLLSK